MIRPSSSPTAARSRCGSSAPAAPLGIRTRRGPHRPRPRPPRTCTRPTRRSGSSSYLDIDAVVAAARDAGRRRDPPRLRLPLRARGVRPGASRRPGITLVGPSAEVMEQMGRKDAAREIAVAAGVPVVPAYGRRRRRRRRSASRCWSRPRPAAAARACGSCAPPTSYDEAVGRRARARPRSAFGDDTMLVEKYVESRPPHRGAGPRRHATATSSTSSSATARPSAATRRCSRRRPAPTDRRRPSASRSPSAAVALAAQVGYDERRHRRVPARRRTPARSTSWR